VIYDWQSKWYAGNKGYKLQLHEDVAIRNRIMGKGQPDAGISKVEIDRNANQMAVTIHTAKPGIVIGRNGANVDLLRTDLEKQTGRRVRVNISEIRVPEMDAYLVARSIAEQLQRRVAFRRAVKQGVQRTMQRGAKGIKVVVAGRLGGSEMSRRETEKQGRIPLHTLRADIDFAIAEAHTTFGRIGVKCWIYKGDIEPVINRPQRDARPEIVPDTPLVAAAEAGGSSAAIVADSPTAPPAETSVTAHEIVADKLIVPAVEMSVASNEIVADKLIVPAVGMSVASNEIVADKLIVPAAEMGDAPAADAPATSE
jgi:small subunit ribosomal protein S3